LQRFIDELLKHLKFYYAHIEEMLVVSTSEDEHKQQFHTWFQLLSEYGVLLNLAISVSGATDVSLLG